MPKPNLDDYITVNQRIESFYAKHEHGSLRTEIVHDDGTRVVVKAYAFRGPDDPAPATGHAEEIRGDGPVNKTSALENCETSAVGRAIAMLGFEVKKGIASREEVEQALAEEKRQKQQPRPPRNSHLAAEDAEAHHHSHISSEDAEGLRQLTLSLNIDPNEVQMKLASMNAETLDDLRVLQVEDYENWLSEAAEKVKA